MLTLKDILFHENSKNKMSEKFSSIDPDWHINEINNSKECGLVNVIQNRRKSENIK